MTAQDVPSVAGLQRRAFTDLDRRMRPVADEPSGGPVEAWVAEARIHHLIGTDPGGAWVFESDGALRGAALALMREGLWGLSLLVVAPEHQSAGIGRALLAATLAYGADATGGLIVASADHRALGAYFRAGFDLRPIMDSSGIVKRRPPAEPAVRAVRWPEDRGLIDEAGRFVRGASHAPDVPSWLKIGARIYVHDDAGFAVCRGGDVKAVAARDPEVAAAVLRAALRDVPAGLGARVDYVTSGQDWAVRTLLDAGLQLEPSGAIMARGKAGPLAPYLPSGAYL